MEMIGAGVDIDALAARLIGRTMPKAEAMAPNSGAAVQAAPDDHVHPSISWRGSQVTNASGLAVYDFSLKPFDVEPVPFMGYFEAAAVTSVASLRVSRWIIGAAGSVNADGASTAGKYVGAEVFAKRSAITLLGIVNLFDTPAANLKTYLIVLPAS